MADSTAGGSVKITHSSMIIFWEPGEGGEVKLIAFTYTRKPKNGNPWTTWRFPNETEDEDMVRNAGKRETPIDTAISGANQEIPPNPHNFQFEFGNSGKPIWVKSCPGDADKGGGIHEKNVFIARIKRGDLRTLIHSEPAKLDRLTGQEIRPAEDLGPPTWFEASRLLDMMYERGLPFHREALVRAVGFLAQDRAVSDHYSKLLSDHSALF